MKLTFTVVVDLYSLPGDSDERLDDLDSQLEDLIAGELIDWGESFSIDATHKVDL